MHNHVTFLWKSLCAPTWKKNIQFQARRQNIFRGDGDSGLDSWFGQRGKCVCPPPPPPYGLRSHKSATVNCHRARKFSSRLVGPLVESSRLGGISSSILSVFFTDKFALSQSDARISVAYKICQWKTLTKRLMKCPPDRGPRARICYEENVKRACANSGAQRSARVVCDVCSHDWSWLVRRGVARRGNHVAFKGIV